jgi:hypothetical protein
MVRLQRQEGSQLPPPPAPPARSANPWKFSETARATEPSPPSRYQRLLEELERDSQQPGEVSQEAQEPLFEQEPAAEAPAARGSGFSKLFPVIVFLIMFASVAREMLEAGASREDLLVLGIGAALLIVVLAAVYFALRLARKQR